MGIFFEECFYIVIGKACSAKKFLANLINLFIPRARKNIILTKTLLLLFKRFVYAFIVDRTVFGDNKIKLLF